MYPPVHSSNDSSCDGGVHECTLLCVSCNFNINDGQEGALIQPSITAAAIAADAQEGAIIQASITGGGVEAGETPIWLCVDTQMENRLLYIPNTPPFLLVNTTFSSFLERQCD